MGGIDDFNMFMAHRGNQPTNLLRPHLDPPAAAKQLEARWCGVSVELRLGNGFQLSPIAQQVKQGQKLPEVVLEDDVLYDPGGLAWLCRGFVVACSMDFA